LNHSTLFHAVYIPSSKGWNIKNDAPPYHVALREDYPEAEVKKWGDEVLDVFRDLIWPYFDLPGSNKAGQT
jgi:hypothetical protein